MILGTSVACPRGTKQAMLPAMQSPPAHHKRDNFIHESNLGNLNANFAGALGRKITVGTK